MYQSSIEKKSNQLDPYVTLLGLLFSSAQGVRAFISRRKASSVRAQLSTKRIHSFSKLWRNAANPRPCRFFPPHVLNLIDKVKYLELEEKYFYDCSKFNLYLFD